MIYQLVYVSSAVRLWTDKALAALLRTSRANNEAAGVTGMLLYQGGNFIQAIEGPEASVKALEARIQADPRHRGVIVLAEGFVPERHFPEWTMGFQRMEGVLGAGEEGQSPAWGRGITPEALVGTPGRALTLLRSFRQATR